MRWKQKDMRVIKRFLIFPVRIGKEYRWLEIAYIKQLYRNGCYGIGWYNEEFVDKDAYVIHRKVK